MSPQIAILAVVLLVAFSVGAVVYVFVFPYLSGEKKADKRRNKIARGQARVGGARVNVEEEHSNRRKQIQDTLKDLEEKQKKKEKINLRLRLIRAGLEITPKTFYLISLGSGVGLAVFSLASGAPPMMAGILGFIGTVGLPQWILKYLIKRRLAKFTMGLANSIDVIVRGVKSGLPLNECLGIISREAPEPIRSEFVFFVEQQRVGVPVGECFDRMISRVPIPEIKFFAIVISIQQQAGGNLAEALGNLSNVLRSRKMLAAKVKAFSAEANASAAILASLPFVVMIMVYLSSPDYIALLWEDPTGHMLLAFGAFWMSCGIMVMRKMINFKY